MNDVSELTGYPGRVTEAVRFSETDMLGHVNNTVFATYFEVGRSSYLSESGFYRQDMVALVIVKTEIEFVGMIYWPGKVEIGTRVSGSGRSSFTMEQLLYQGERLVGRSASTMVLLDRTTNRSTPIPDDIRAMLRL